MPARALPGSKEAQASKDLMVLLETEVLMGKMDQKDSRDPQVRVERGAVGGHQVLEGFLVSLAVRGLVVTLESLG